MIVSGKRAEQGAWGTCPPTHWELSPTETAPLSSCARYAGSRLRLRRPPCDNAPASGGCRPSSPGLSAGLDAHTTPIPIFRGVNCSLSGCVLSIFQPLTCSPQVSGRARIMLMIGRIGETITCMCQAYTISAATYRRLLLRAFARFTPERDDTPLNAL